MLRAVDVDFGYQRGAPVLRSVSAVFDRGITAVVGPNGSGKTTLLRLLAGLLRPEAGHVNLGGAGITSLSAQARARFVAYVPQRPVVSAAFTVRRVVELGRYALHDDPAAVDRALHAADVSALADKVFGALSTGEQQRVTLARALAQLDRGGADSGPLHLLADEPTAAMDPEHRLLTAELLSRLGRDGVCVVVVLHDLTLARRLAERALVLGRDGAVRAFGPVEQALSPETLRDVFAVKFVQIDGPSGPVLVAERRLTDTRLPLDPAGL